MGRIGITYQDIEQAIQTIISKQKNPTVDSIREVLGTGSKSTIARFLKEWRTQHNTLNPNELALPEVLLNAVKNLWERMREQIESQMQECQQEADKQVVHAKTQLENVIAKNKELELLVKKQENEILVQAEKNQKLHDNLTLLQNEKNTLLERITSFDIRHQDNQNELERLHLLLKHVQENLAHYQTATHQLRQEHLLHLEKQHNEYEQKNIELRQKMTSLIENKSLLEAQMTHLNQRYIELQHEHQHIMQKLEIMQQEYQKLSLAHQAMQQSHDFIAKQHQQQSEVLHLKNNLEIELRVMLEAIKQDKVTALSQAQEKILALQQEKEALFEQKTNIEVAFRKLKEHYQKA